jgi:hypothetical protein
MAVVNIQIAENVIIRMFVMNGVIKIDKSIDETIEILQGRDKCMNKLKPGDMIECVDKEDMVETMMQLAQEDVETEFVYERDGVKGYWLEVIRIEDVHSLHE